MTTKQPSHPERLDQLMVDRATQGLSPQDEVELAEAIARDGTLEAEAESYELAATAIELALIKPSGETLPSSLRGKLVADASSFIHGSVSQAARPDLTLAGSSAEASPAVQQSPSSSGFSFTDGRAFGWYAAAAAVVALCIILVQQPTDNSTVRSNINIGSTTSEPADAYAQLAQDESTIAATWSFLEESGEPRFANATGEVIWNTQTQTGYMKLAGLPVNDPTQEQYQLWIVDATRTGNETTDRIDGGVFDITDTGEVIIPIDAKITARQPVAFAITVEQPGGVVVSKGPLQVIAPVDAG